MDALADIQSQGTSTLLLWALIGYLSGSVPYGVLMARVFNLGDLRKVGSGNIGATNVLRTGSRWAAALTLLFDALKATVPVLLACHFAGEVAGVLAGFAAFLGHVFPIWLQFRGGKGVATYFGVLLGLGWKLVLVFAIAWLTMAAVFRYSSLAALVACILVPLYGAYAYSPTVAFGIAAMSIIVFFRHHENIRRLLAGDETRIGGKSGS